MRKRELVHLHALLDHVGRFMHEHEALSDAVLEDYEALGIAPAAIYKTKGDHKRAVTALSEALATVAEADDANRVDAPDDTEQRASIRSD